MQEHAYYNQHIRKIDASIIQGIPRDLGPLCQTLLLLRNCNSFRSSMSKTAVGDQVLVRIRGRDKYTCILIFILQHSILQVTLKTELESNLNFFKVINTNAILK